MTLGSACKSSALVFGLLCAGACFEDSQAPEGTSASSGSGGVCTPGEQVNCDCPDAPGSGVQRCNTDGTALAPCECGDTTSSTTSDPTASGTSSGVTSATSTSGTTAVGSSSGDDTSGTAGSEPPPIVVFSTGLLPGDFAEPTLDTRSEADALCTVAENAQRMTCKQIHAVLCADSGDDIQTMQDMWGVPRQRPVESTDGTELADTWTDFLGGTLQSSLTVAGVTDEGPWTGTNAMGVCEDSCLFWTQDNSMGNVGNAQTTTPGGWISGAASAGCSEARPLLCACW